jgi:hypothetical protein
MPEPKSSKESGKALMIVPLAFGGGCAQESVIKGSFRPHNFGHFALAKYLLQLHARSILSTLFSMVN